MSITFLSVLSDITAIIIIIITVIRGISVYHCFTFLFFRFLSCHLFWTVQNIVYFTLASFPPYYFAIVSCKRSIKINSFLLYCRHFSAAIFFFFLFLFFWYYFDSLTSFSDEVLKMVFLLIIRVSVYEILFLFQCILYACVRSSVRVCVCLWVWVWV